MTKAKWKSRIKKNCTEAGTYKKCFDSVIDTLAGILESRDKAEEAFEASGGQPLITHTNKAGAENLEQHPAVRLINDYNRDALAYWRELGLTPKGLRAINEAAVKNVTRMSPLEEALEKLNG